MNRRRFFQTTAAGALAAASARGQGRGPFGLDCDCAPMLQAVASDPGARIQVTEMKVFGVTIDRTSDRPYVFVKLETNQGLVGWGEATLEGKAGATIACVNDLRPFVIGADPMRVEHIWQGMYVHSFYRAGPVIGSAISGIDQALWDLRGKAMGLPVYKLLGGPFDPRGVRGYYHLTQGAPVASRGASFRERVAAIRERAEKYGVTAFKTGIPGFYEWLERRSRIRGAIDQLRTLREVMGDKIDIGIDLHAKSSPSVIIPICKATEDLHLMFMEEPCPPENVEAMEKIARATTVPIATGERLITHYASRELIERGIVDIIQTDINHVGGITALWKTAAMAAPSGVRMAPHSCEGPIGALATIHVDAAMPNFFIQEICSGVEPGEKEKIWEEWLGFPAMRMVNGRFPLLDKPGLGFELTEEALAKYPFQGTVPFSRPYLQDGSVASP